MTTQSTQFVPQQAGITAWVGHTKIDFVFEGPNTAKDRFSTSDGLSGELNGKEFAVVDIECNDADQPEEPTHIKVRYGSATYRLGRRWNASGDPSFYASIGPSRPVNAAKTSAAIKMLLGS